MVNEYGTVEPPEILQSRAVPFVICKRLYVSMKIIEFLHGAFQRKALTT